MNSSLRGIVRKTSKLTELIFFPSFCAVCSSLLQFPQEKIVCGSCLSSIMPHGLSCCLCCGQFFYYPGESHLCIRCQENPPPFAVHRSCGRYEGMLKDIILLYKYRKFRVLGKALAEFICRSLGKKEELWKGVEVVVSVPLHPKRRRERGFNQAEVIADQLAKKKGIECTHRALIKIRNTLPQTSLLAEERRKNVKGAMGIREKEKIAGKTVLLVDDVYTTGATMGECSVALKRGGAKEVRALTLAQA